MADANKQFNRVYDQYIEKIYRFIYLKVDSREIAEDITSKVFTKYWEASRKRQQIENPIAFLYQIARNNVIDHYRQRGRTSFVSTNYEIPIIDTRADIHQQAVTSADIEMVKSALKSIKKDYQDVLIWYYLEDMKTDQIAQLINKPAGTVRVMIHRGLKFLKSQLS